MLIAVTALYYLCSYNLIASSHINYSTKKYVNLLYKDYIYYNYLYVLFIYIYFIRSKSIVKLFIVLFVAARFELASSVSSQVSDLLYKLHQF